MIYLHNLTSSAAYQGNPWDLSLLADIPARFRGHGTKTARSAWANEPTTKHCFYSGWEGLNPSVRISKPTRAEEGNPPRILHALVADFDAVLTAEEVHGGISRLSPLVPTHYERSLSGKCHLIWNFAAPITIEGFDLAKAFLEVAANHLRLDGALPSFDKAFFNPSIYYTASGEIFELGAEPLSPALLLGWLIEASKKTRFETAGPAVPLPEVREELMRTHPKFANSEWANTAFEEGAQGPTWWVEGSSSPKSAIVKTNGMFTFSQHASRNFYSWSDLLGTAWTQQYLSKSLGEKARDLYFDGRDFWRQTGKEQWKSFTRDDTRSYLRTVRKVDPRPRKGQFSSELDEIYLYIQENQFIEGAAPFVFKPNGLIVVDGSPFLNVSTRRPIQPCSSGHKLAVWGREGGFPNLSQMLGAPSCEVARVRPEKWFFAGREFETDAWMAWLQYFYQTALDMRLASGQNVFLAGPANAGKTFLHQGFIGTIMRGSAKAEAYLSGKDSFGSNLFGHAWWTVDDQTMVTTETSIRFWSEMLKRMSSNKLHEYHEKFRSRTSVQWEGRVGITCNLDSESTRILINTDISTRDKTALNRANGDPTFPFRPRQEDNIAIVEQEAPYFLRYLLDWKRPDACVQLRDNGDVDTRFGGVKPWHDQHLLAASNQSSQASAFWEILDDWKSGYFEQVNDGRPKTDRITIWQGTAWQLKKAMSISSSATQEALRSFTHDSIGRRLSQLATRGGYGIEVVEPPIGQETAPRQWIIHEHPR